MSANSTAGSDSVSCSIGCADALIVRSVKAQGCVRSFVIRDKQYILPVNGDISVDLGTLKPGRLDYTCAVWACTPAP